MEPTTSATCPVTDVARDDVTGDLYAGTDFGVVRLRGRGLHLDARCTGDAERGSAGLTIVPGARRLYAATHGFGAWSLNLP